MVDQTQGATPNDAAGFGMRVQSAMFSLVNTIPGQEDRDYALIFSELEIEAPLYLKPQDVVKIPELYEMTMVVREHLTDLDPGPATTQAIQQAWDAMKAIMAEIKEALGLNEPA